MTGRIVRKLRRFVQDESGLTLPLLALLLVTLLVFAAFAVDLGAAWAERRLDQSGADASVMAGAVEFVVGAPTQADIVDEVRDFGEKNIGLPAASPDWEACVDADRGATYVPLVDSDGDTIDCISISPDPGGGAGMILRTRVPDQTVDTFFASVIGRDTLIVSADAEAEVKLGIAGEGGIIPFALPRDYSPEECLGTPPDGQIPEDSVCQGPQQGNFGIIDSPHFGHPASPHGTALACPPPGLLARVSHQVAIGLDHNIRITPVSPVPPPGTKPATGADACPQPLLWPYVLNTRTGDPFSGGGGGAWPPIPKSPNVAVAVGLVGDGPFGTPGQIGRLRRAGGYNSGSGTDVRALATTDPPTVFMDNVGLWEYLTAASNGNCAPGQFTGKTGTALTTQMSLCLSSSKSNPGTNKPSFDTKLLESPRFALVPLLEYKFCSDGSDPLCLNGQAWVHVVGLRPVYLQSTWYKCGGPNFCIWESTDAHFLQAFNPGEGTLPGCEGVPDTATTTGACTGVSQPNQVSMKGVSAFVLEWDYLPPEADPTGTGSPFFAELFK